MNTIGLSIGRDTMFERQASARPRRQIEPPVAAPSTFAHLSGEGTSGPPSAGAGRFAPDAGFDFGNIAIFPSEPQIGSERDEVAPALADRIRGQQGGGAPLETPVQRQMEAGFGHSIANIRIHADGEADTLSRSVGATAFTTGRDLFFRDGAYDPGSRAGQHLLVHEIAHTFQQASGPVSATPMPGGIAVSDPADPFERAAGRTAADVLAGRPVGGQEMIAPSIVAASSDTAMPVVQRFGSKEHQLIGDEATGGETMSLDIGDPQQPLSYGQVLALAGDYFQSVEEIRSLADPKNPEGQAQIRWAREDGMGIKASPPVSKEAETAAKDRYYTLAANNITHFSGGGTARNEYERVHQQALAEAFEAGVTGDWAKFSDAKVTEAFSNHYLTDMFAAGHVRTPRQEMKAWYLETFPPDGGISQLVSYIANYITEKLIAYGNVPWYWPTNTLRGRIQAKVEELGGPAIKAYSLGDIVSLAYHDYDNEHGLYVVSEAGPDGKTVPGGYLWPELDKGDSHLKESPLTKQMAEAAVRDSLQDLSFVLDAGQQAGAGKCLAPEEFDAQLHREIDGMQPFAAEGYIPREAKSGEVMDGGNVQMDWHWGSLDPILHAAVDATMKGEIADELGKITPPDMQLDRMGDPDKDGAVHLEVGKAFTELVGHLRSEGIAVLELAMRTAGTWNQPSEELRASVPPDAGAPPAAMPAPVPTPPAP
jgi:hypothetical protein